MQNIDSIFAIQNANQFKKIALEVFRFQAENNLVYKQFISHLNVDINAITKVEEIPFLPISFFKSHEVLSTKNAIQKTFFSSGTTAQVRSKHHVTDISVYEKSFRKGFQQFYGNIEEYTVLALLPNYLENESSSLVYMVDDLIKKSKNPESGFFLDNLPKLAKKLSELDQKGQKIILIGVTYALLDLVEMQKFHLKNTIIIETGGMKGRRKEIIREELHSILKNGFGVKNIHSEYGMTELLSQAYLQDNGIFKTPPWMKILIRDTEDALQLLPNNKTGGINVIDLANINSCSFIATQDLGKKFNDTGFTVLGRFDHSDIRGCNLLI